MPDASAASWAPLLQMKATADELLSNASLSYELAGPASARAAEAAASLDALMLPDADPIVEAVTGMAFVLQFWQLGWQPLLAVRLLFVAAMIVLFVIDLQHRMLPNVLTLPGLTIGLVASVFLEPGWRAACLGVIIGGGALWAVGETYVRIRGVEGMGFGDVKMLAMIGAFLGWQLTLTTVLIASLTGALVGGIMVLFDRANVKYPLPLGSFLAAGAIIVSHVGQPLVEWYLGFY